MQQYTTIVEELSRADWAMSPTVEAIPVEEHYGQDNLNGYRTTTSNTARKAPPSSLHHESSNSTLASTKRTSGGQFVELAREAMRIALEENKSQTSDANGGSNELKPGVTIDLSHKNIQQFPDEVIDIIKNELERLALSHNLLSTFPARFAECTSLRYLNVRNNAIREFPIPICQLPSLEILDMGRNKLRILPPDLAKLTSLKVLSVHRNRIETLPVCLADMASLQVLKLEGNPLQFPPPEILQPQPLSPANKSVLKEGEVDELSVTAQIKRYLKQKVIQDRSETESGGEESSEGAETPRPLKRVMSGRFPIRVNGGDGTELRSPGLPRAPPIPSRSHQRGLSQQNAAARRPGPLPLSISNSNERLRSNSESLLLQAGRERTERSDRSRRMGMLTSTKRSSDAVLDEDPRTNRYSHYRGLSHGSALRSDSNGVSVTSSLRYPYSPAEQTSSRGANIRRLSSLPERKRKSVEQDPIIKGATGIYYALSQIQPVVQSVMILARDGTDRRTSLELVFYNASSHVDELERDITAYNTCSEEDEDSGPRSTESVHRACVTCISAYTHIFTQLSGHVDSLLENGDPRYIRTLLWTIYGSLVEIRNTATSLLVNKDPQRLSTLQEGTLKPKPRLRSITPTQDRQDVSLRARSATVVNQAIGLRVATSSARPPYLKTTGRSATISSATPTPRSTESFVSSGTPLNRYLAGGDFADDDRLFERIFQSLQTSSEIALKTIPPLNEHFIATMKRIMQQGRTEHLKQYFRLLCQRCLMTSQTAEQLRNRLSMIKLKEPGIKTQGAFWELCSAFIAAYYNLVSKIKEVKTMTDYLTTEVTSLLRPLHKAMKETGALLQASPWSVLAGLGHPNGNMRANIYGMPPQSPQVPLPMTPASAALGPAVQATVPSAVQNGSIYSAMFAGNVFERAEALLSGATSRNGTMTSASSFGLNDGTISSSSTFSPMNATNGYRGRAPF